MHEIKNKIEQKFTKHSLTSALQKNINKIFKKKSVSRSAAKMLIIKIVAYYTSSQDTNQT